MVVGGGGREHALAWHIARGPAVSEVLVAPGNAGTEAGRKMRNLAVDPMDIPALCDCAQRHGVALTIIGPEAPLVAGVVDAFAARGLRCFGPSRRAAALEGSKAFAKAFMRRHDVPTADFEVFDDADAAAAWIHRRGVPVVVKADGLAAGKGVFVTDSPAAAEAAVRRLICERALGDAGRRVVVEDRLSGEELSFIALVGAGHALALASSQDHKARDDGDLGPNTGGMGAYSPVPQVSPALLERIMRRVIEPTVAGMAAEGRPYTGFLYAGLMLDANGEPRALEYNCRLGDPEAQPLLMRLASELPALCGAALDGELERWNVDWDRRAALGVVLAARGYPGDYATGEPIVLPADLDADGDDDQMLFHAGTVRRDGRLLSAGGRCLCATALGDTVAEAGSRAYALAERVRWAGGRCRRDIGWRAAPGAGPAAGDVSA